MIPFTIVRVSRGVRSGQKALSAVATSRRLSSTAENPSDFAADKGIYSARSTRDLLFSLSILNLCRLPYVAKIGDALLSKSEGSFMQPILVKAIEQTVFKQFCSGTSVEESMPVIGTLQKLNVKSILDFSVEDADSEETCDRNAADFTRIIKETSPIASVSFGCVKVTAFAQESVLERVSDILLYRTVDKSFSPHWLEDHITFMAEANGFTPSKPLDLSPEELSVWRSIERRFRQVCEASAAVGKSLLVDAEMSNVQPAIDYLTLSNALAFNRTSPLLYNTYQLYTKDGLQRLQTSASSAKAKGVFFGAKLVRGAYMNAETKISERLGRPYPCFTRPEDTHNAYNKAVDYCLRNVDNTSVMVASHNKGSCEGAVAAMAQQGLAASDQRVHFAQLYGMADYLTLGLARRNVNVSKYVPFGPVAKVMRLGCAQEDTDGEGIFFGEWRRTAL